MLKIKDLTVQYNGITAIDKITMDIGQGEIIGYIGPNGSGKTTTIKTIVGIQKRFLGTIECFGKNIKNSDDYKSIIGYMPDSTEVFETLTGLEYLLFIGSLHSLNPNNLKENIDKWLSLFDLLDSKHKLIKDYSKGMKQKLLLIGAILHKPKLLFLDEPLSGLDIKSVEIVKLLLSKLSGLGVTIFFSSHILEVVANLSTRVIILNKGKLLLDTKVENENYDLEKLKELYSNITEIIESSEIIVKLLNDLYSSNQGI